MIHCELPLLLGMRLRAKFLFFVFWFWFWVFASEWPVAPVPFVERLFFLH